MSKETAVIIKGQFPSQFSECVVIQLHHFAEGYEFIILPEREERIPTRCNKIDDLLSIADIDY